MSAPKFTPGPWFGGAIVSGNGISEHITTVGGQRIASVGSHDVQCGGLPSMYTALYENTGDRLDVLNANARLIAAAPDMYEALERLLRTSLIDGGTRCAECEQHVENTSLRTCEWCSARAVLAKAVPQ